MEDSWSVGLRSTAENLLGSEVSGLMMTLHGTAQGVASREIAFRASNVRPGLITWGAHETWPGRTRPRRAVNLAPESISSGPLANHATKA